MKDKLEVDMDPKENERDSICDNDASELDELVYINEKEIKDIIEFDNEDQCTEQDITDDANPETDASVNYKLTTNQAWFNLLLLSSSFMVMFSGVNTFISVQSTLNKDDGLGTIGLTVLYSSAFITVVFLPIALSRFRSKIIIAVAIVTYIAYVATGYHSTWSTVIPGAVIIGIGSPHLWVASQSYITDLVKYSETSSDGARPEMITMFFGVFFALQSSSQVWGNLFSSLVFGGRGDAYNQSTTDHEAVLCGAMYCPGITTNNTNLNPPSTEKINMYTSICIGCISVAILGTVFLRNLPFIPRPRVSICGRVMNVFKHMFTSKTQRYLMAVSLFRSVSRVFVTGDFTVAFVSCTLGVEYVGFVMLAYGAVTAVFSLLAGKVCKYTGELVLLILAFAVQIAVCIAMLLWEPTRQQSVVIYVLASLWGVADAIYAPTITGLYSMFFTKNRDDAFSSFKFLDTFGFALAFAYSGFLCTDVKIYIILLFIVLSSGCVIVLLRNKNKHFQ